MTFKDVVWNRAALDNGGRQAREGDTALAALLVVHGMIKNGGLEHAFELRPEELERGLAGYRFFDFTEFANLLESLAASTDREGDGLDARYGDLVPTEASIEAALERKLEGPSYLFEPVDFSQLSIIYWKPYDPSFKRMERLIASVATVAFLVVLARLEAWLYFWLIAAPTVPLIAAGLLLMIFPRIADTEVTIAGDQWIIKCPWRHRRSFRESEIQAIAGIATNEGSWGDEVDLLIQWSGGSTRIPERIHFPSRLFDRVRAWDGFDADAYRRACVCELGFFEIFTGRRFLLWARRSASKTPGDDVSPAGD